MFVCVCVCVCVRERESVCVCLCVCLNSQGKSWLVQRAMCLCICTGMRVYKVHQMHAHARFCMHTRRAHEYILIRDHVNVDS